MPESVGLAWYSTGTVTLTQGSTAVVGVGTNWENAGLKIGDIFTIDRVTLYMIASVNSNTSITLAQAYAGTSGNSMNYYVIRNFAATLQAELSAQVSQLVGDYESWKDGRVNEIAIPFDFSSLYKGVWATGRSYKALDIVMYNSALYVCLLAHTSASGNTPGTAGAINYWGSYAPAMPPSIDVLNYNNAGSHNSLYRGKNLGTSITAAQLAAIRNRTFVDLYVGDSWRFSIDGNTVNASIKGFSFTFGVLGVIVLLTCDDWMFPLNDTADCSGGLANSTLQNEIFPQLLAKINTVIPDEYIAEMTFAMSDAVDRSGATTHFVYKSTKLLLPSPYNIGLPQANPTWASNSAYQQLSFIRWPACNFTQFLSKDSWLAFSFSNTAWGLKYNWAPSVWADTVNQSHYVSPYLILS